MESDKFKVATLEKVCSTIYRYPSFYGMERSTNGIPVVSGEHFIGRNAISEDMKEFWFISKEISSIYPKTILELSVYP